MSGFAHEDPPSVRAFTVKSIGLGLVLGVGINFFAGFAEQVLRVRVIGGMLSPAAFIPLFALIMIWNPGWVIAGRRFPAAGRLALSPREMAVSFGMSMVACFAPTSSLYRYFHQAIIVPVLRMEIHPHWRPIVESADPRLFPLRGNLDHPDYDAVYTRFATGASEERGLLAGLDAVPWQAWLEPMTLWGPLLLSFTVVGIALALVVHRQWTRHEVLAYPLATVADGLLARAPRRAWPDIFGSRLFWAAALSVAGYHALRVLAAYWPDVVPEPPSRWFVDFGGLLPSLRHSGYAPGSGRLFFVFVGIAYFLASDTGLTLGLSNVLLAALAVQVYGATGRPLAYGQVESMRAGGYMAYALLLLYAGRFWYGRLLREAFRIRRPGGGAVDPQVAAAVWGMRAFLVGVAALAWSLRCLGLPWIAALTLAAYLPTFVLVMARLVCEAGIPIVTFRLFSAHLTTLLGPAALGPKGLATMALVGQAVAQDPREALLPYAATAYRVGEARGIRPARMAPWLLVAALVALTAGFAARSWTYYTWGGLTDAWASNNALAGVGSLFGELHRYNLWEASVNADEWTRVLLVSPRSGPFAWLATGAVVTLALAALRLRFSAWPIHPLLVLLWGSHASAISCQAIFIGWMVKSLVVTYGGGRVYQAGKPFFIGMIVGELAVGGAAMVLGVVIYQCSGQWPPAVAIFPD